MAGILASFNGETNFWEELPQMKFIGEFKKFYKKDRTKEKNKSSKIMWAIAMLLEIEDNKLALYPEEDRMLVIQEDWLEDTKFKWKDYKNVIDEYKKSVMTPAKRALYEQRKKTDERTRFLASVKYTLDNAKELDNLLANTEKFLSILKKLEESVAVEEATGSKKGGRAESLSEQGVI